MGAGDVVAVGDGFRARFFVPLVFAVVSAVTVFFVQGLPWVTVSGGVLRERLDISGVELVAVLPSIAWAFLAGALVLLFVRGVTARVVGVVLFGLGVALVFVCVLGVSGASGVAVSRVAVFTGLEFSGGADVFVRDVTVFPWLAGFAGVLVSVAGVSAFFFPVRAVFRSSAVGAFSSARADGSFVSVHEADGLHAGVASVDANVSKVLRQDSGLSSAGVSDAAGQWDALSAGYDPTVEGGG